MAEQQFPAGTFDGWTSFLTGTTLIDTLGGTGKGVRAVDVGGDWVDIGNAGTTVNVGPGDLLIVNRSSSTSQCLRVHSGRLNVDMTQSDGYIGLDTWYVQTDPGTPTQGGFRVMNTGIVRIIGGTMKLRSSIIISSGADIQWRDCYIEGNSTGPQNDQIRTESTKAEFRDWTLYKGYFTIIQIPAVNIGYRPRNCAVALGFSGSTPDQNVPIEGYDTDLSNLLDVSMWTGGQPCMVDSVQAHLTVTGPNSPGNLNVWGIQRMFRRANFGAVDATGNPIAGLYAVKLRDGDSGRRKPAYTRERFGAAPYDIDRDLAYVFTPGELGMVLCSATLAQDTGTVPNEGNFAPDYRFDGGATFPYQVADLDLSQAFDAEMNFGMWGIGLTVGSADLPMASDGGPASVSTTLFPDPSWMNSPEAGPHDTAVKAQDYWHHWTAGKLDAIKAGTPAITDDSAGYDVVPAPGATAQAAIGLLEGLGGVGQYPTTRSGNTLAAGARPVVLDPNQVSDFDGATVTIQAATWADGIETTGGVTAAAGVTSVDDATITGNLTVVDPLDTTDLTVTGTFTSPGGDHTRPDATVWQVTAGGTYNLVDSQIATIENTTGDGAPVTINLRGNSVTPSKLETDGPVILQAPTPIRLTDNQPFWVTGTNLTTGVELDYRGPVTATEYNLAPGEDYRFAVASAGLKPDVFDVTGSGVPEVWTLAEDTAVDPDRDVDYLLDISTLELTPTGLDVYVNPVADLDVGPEDAKTFVHLLGRREIALRGFVAAGTAQTLTLSPSRLRVNLPLYTVNFHPDVADGIKIEIDIYVDQDNAQAVDPGYIINPMDSGNRYVVFLGVPTELSADDIADTVADLVLPPVVDRLDADESKTADGLVRRYRSGTTDQIGPTQQWEQDCKEGTMSITTTTETPPP